MSCFLVQQLQPVIDAEVAKLLDAKNRYKTATGTAWTADVMKTLDASAPSATKEQKTEAPKTTPAPPPPTAPSVDGMSILHEIRDVGDRVRQLKAEKAARRSRSFSVALTNGWKRSRPG